MLDLKAKVPSNLVGAAGEHYVLSQLYLQGLNAGLAPVGTKDIDVLVFDPDDKVQAQLQVKTARRVRSWSMNAKHVTRAKAVPVFAFVAFLNDGPEIYLIPGGKVAEVVQESHHVWLNTPGMKGQAHQDNPMRKIQADYGMLQVPSAPTGWMEQYRNAWHLLKSGRRTKSSTSARSDR